MSATRPAADARGRTSIQVLLVAMAVLIATLLAHASPAAAVTAGPDFDATGPEETVYDWSANQCDYRNYSDLPSRAIRDSQGREQLIMSHSSFADGSGGARRITGAYLGGSLAQGNLTLNCTPVFRSDHRNDPSSFNNYEWLSALYTTDGQKINALVYDEFYGWEWPPTSAQCKDATTGAVDFDCWYSGLTYSSSTDRGDNYSSSNPTVATLPYQYQAQDGSQPEDNDGAPFGYFTGTNIAKGPDGYYYSMFFANKFRQQQAGTCVMRTQNLSDPSSWRMYRQPVPGQDGDFTTPFVNPYPTPPANPGASTCTPVAFPQIAQMSSSLTYSRYLKRYMLVGQFAGDFYYSLSTDMIHWDAARKLLDVNLVNGSCTGNTGEEQPVLYPSVIDHNSTSRNFETVGRDFYLYYTRFNAGPSGVICRNGRWVASDFTPGSHPGDDRDLIRIPIRIKVTPSGTRNATFEDGQVVNSNTGFDSASSSGGGFDLRTGGAYEGNNYVQATYLSGSSSPHGTINLPGWFNGTDVWYGSAFFITSGFAAAHDNGTILEWSNAFRSSTGGLSLGSDHQWHLTHNSQNLGSAFSLPEGQWIWVEVHQKLESNPSKSPLSEVFVNGRPVSSSAAVNANPDTDAAPVWLKVGFVRLSGQPSALFVDRASVSWTERGPIGAPPTPTAFSGTEQDRLTTLWWQGTPPVGGGFRLYRSNADGTYFERYNTTTNAVFDNYQLNNCTRYLYRVSAYDAQGRESAKSEPLELMPRGAGGCP